MSENISKTMVANAFIEEKKDKDKLNRTVCLKNLWQLTHTGCPHKNRLKISLKQLYQAYF